MVHGRKCETLKEAKELQTKMNGLFSDTNRIFKRKKLHPKSKFRFWVGCDLEWLNGFHGA